MILTRDVTAAVGCLHGNEPKNPSVPAGQKPTTTGPYEMSKLSAPQTGIFAQLE